MANAAYVQGTVSVGTSATRICSSGVSGGVLVQNNGSVAVFLGGATVTATGATAGISLAAGAVVVVPAQGEVPRDLYGVVASSTANVAFLLPA